MNWLVYAAYTGIAALAELAAGLAAEAAGEGVWSMGEQVPRSTRERRHGKVTLALAGRHGAIERLERWGAESRDAQRPLLWIHASSAGEGMMALAIAEQLRAAVPSLQLAYTYFSPSAERFASALGADVSDYLPFDTARAARRALAALRPTALVFVRGDVWPILTETAAHAGIPTALVNATMSAHSRRSTRLSRPVLASAYAALDVVGVVGAADGERYAAAGARPDRIRVTGDARYDQAWARARAGREDVLIRKLYSDRPTVVAGSTWTADERRLFPAWTAVRRTIPDARLVIAAHEPGAAHTDAIRMWGVASGMRVAQIDGAAAGAADVLVVDRVGVLAELYALARVAYVGGGFHRAGLHSVVEPAVLGVPSIVGPRHDTRDAELLLDAGGAVAVGDEWELCAAMLSALRDGERRAAMSAAALAVASSELGAAVRSAAIVRELLGAV